MESAQSVPHKNKSAYGTVVDVSTRTDNPSILIVCEHASHHIPKHLNNLGLIDEVRASHAAWDLGALGVAMAMVDILPALLIRGCVSRLVYDCNRPPEAQSAIPEKSEIYEIPGNVNLSAEERQERVDCVYRPFEAALRDYIARHRAKLALMVTIHTFTPVFHAQRRDVEIGILHGLDARLACAMMDTIPSSNGFDVRLNEPYSAQDGVTHTLDLHGARNGLENVMIEIRNDLVQTPKGQHALAQFISGWLTQAISLRNKGAA